MVKEQIFVLVDKDLKSLQETHKLMNSNLSILQSDLTDSTAPKLIINSCLQNFGGIDILISNAGYALESSILDLDIKH